MIDLKPCPFCGSKEIAMYACDDDSFIKTLKACCDECGCEMRSAIDYRPFSLGESKDYESAWKLKITEKWNRRASIEQAVQAVPSWQPIEVAPYGVDLLVFGTNGYIHRDYRSKQYRDDWSHWMPLPAAPQPDQKKG